MLASLIMANHHLQLGGRLKIVAFVVAVKSKLLILRVSRVGTLQLDGSQNWQKVKLQKPNFLSLHARRELANVFASALVISNTTIGVFKRTIYNCPLSKRETSKSFTETISKSFSKHLQMLLKPTTTILTKKNTG
jgi:hypothetical protein